MSRSCPKIECYIKKTLSQWVGHAQKLNAILKPLSQWLGHAQKLNSILKTLTQWLGHAQKLNAILKNLKSVGMSCPKIECYIKKP